MLTTIEVTVDKTGHLHSVESGQPIKPGRALLTWLESDATHEPALIAEAALRQDRLNPEENAAWNSFFLGAATVTDDFMVERASQTQTARENI